MRRDAHTYTMNPLDTTRAVFLKKLVGDCEGIADTLIGDSGRFNTFYREVEKAAAAEQMTHDYSTTWTPESREETAARLFSMGHSTIGLECLQQVDNTQRRGGRASNEVEKYMWLINHCLWCARDNDVRWRASLELQNYTIARKKKPSSGASDPRRALN